MYFAGQRTHPTCSGSYFINAGSVITFNDVVSNQGNGFNGRTGLFKAPVSGVYAFTFTGRNSERSTPKSSRVITRIFVYHNEVFKVNLSNGHEGDHFSMISGSWQMRLDKNDAVQLKVASGALLVHCKTKAIFTGVLIEEI